MRRRENSTRASNRARLLDFLATIRRPDRSLDALADSESLVGAGLIDSLALLEIVAWLETEYALDFSERGVDPEQLASVGRILDLIET